MNNDATMRPLVGMGVMIFKDDTVLLGKRKGAHGAGEWSFPGGHFEYMESFEDNIRRETLEEAGIEITNICFQMIANIKEYDPRHYFQVGFTAQWHSGEPTVMEPEKCEAWEWFALDALPDPIFTPARLMIESHRSGKICFDA